MEDTVSKLASSMADFLKSLEGGKLRDGTAETPTRFVKQIQECLVGYQDDPNKHLKLFNNSDYHDLIIVSRISFSSLCEHHLLPFYGTIDIGYLPKDKILGLSKFARIVDVLSKRLQVQEKLTSQLAQFFAEKLISDLVMVRIRAQHTCMMVRGVSRSGSVTETFTIVGTKKGNQAYIRQFQQLAENPS